MPCRAHLGEVRERVERAGAWGDARWIAVSFEPAAALAARREELHGDFFDLCSDPTRAAYAAFGLPRVPLARLFGWRTLGAYARGLLAGRVEFRRGGDVHQIGGDFVVDGTGVLRLVYRSAEPGDRPSVASLLDALDRLD